MMKSKLKGTPQIINLIDFYLPVRGNLRRKSSMASDIKEGKEDEESVAKEITEINKNYDFDVPSAIDWELLIVSSI